MADDDDKKELSHEEALASIRDSLKKASEHFDNMNDMLDHVESRLPTVTGGKPLPQRRPIAAGPDAAGNNRSSNKWYDGN
jgi:hypothetical protein